MIVLTKDLNLDKAKDKIQCVIKCAMCAKTLAKGSYVCLSIKCPRCKTVNSFTTTAAETTAPRVPNL